MLFRTDKSLNLSWKDSFFCSKGWAAIAFVWVALCRLPLYVTATDEGDALNIAAGVAAWIKGGSFCDVPLYRYEYQPLTYYLLTWTTRLMSFLSFDAMQSFYLTTYVFGSLFCVFLASWFVKGLCLSGAWMPVVAMQVMMVPELFFASTVYPNTSIIAFSIILAGHYVLFMQHRITLYHRMLAAFLYALGWLCRFDAILLIAPVLLLTDPDKHWFSWQTLKKTFGIVALTALIWIVGTIVLQVNYQDLIETIHLHQEYFPSSLFNQIKMVAVGGSPNIQILALFSLVIMLIVPKFQNWVKPVLLPFALLGTPSLITLPWLTTPKYLLPFFAFTALVALLLPIFIFGQKLKSMKCYAIVLLIGYSLHLGVGWSQQKTLKIWDYADKVDTASTQDGLRPWGFLVPYVRNIAADPPAYSTLLITNLITHCQTHGGHIGVVTPDWEFWGRQRFLLVQQALTYSRNGISAHWCKYPIWENYQFEKGSIRVYSNYEVDQLDLFHEHLTQFDLLYCPDDFLKVIPQIYPGYTCRFFVTLKTELFENV